MVDIGCDLNATNKDGDTALHVVASKRRLDSLIWLLIEGANVNAQNAAGDTALDVAVRSAQVPKPQDAWMLFKQKVEQKNHRRQKKKVCSTSVQNEITDSRALLRGLWSFG